MKAIHNFSTQLLYTDYCRAGVEWKYSNIVSPFSRVYLVTGGAGVIYINQVKYTLEAGDLFIIPKFTSHSYDCDDFIEHYYLCFFDEMIGQRSIFDLIEFQNKVKATEVDYMLFQQIVKNNKAMGVPHHDPKMYNSLKESPQFHPFQSVMDILGNMESSGIIMQVLSRFFNGSKAKSASEMEGGYHKLAALLNHINNNLSSPLKTQDLAALMYLSTDHFSRIFKRIMGISAQAYVQQKRIERAQALLITSRFSIQEVATIVGIPNISQFSSLFRKMTQSSPRGYIKKQIEIMRNNRAL